MEGTRSQRSTVTGFHLSDLGVSWKVIHVDMLLKPLPVLLGIFPVCPRRIFPCNPIEALTANPAVSASPTLNLVVRPHGIPPFGLGVRAPEEMVVSITVEIIAHANGASGLPLFLRTGPIQCAVAEILPPHTLSD